jgi:hypothetical protein
LSILAKLSACPTYLAFKSAAIGQYRRWLACDPIDALRGEVIRIESLRVPGKGAFLSIVEY